MNQNISTQYTQPTSILDSHHPIVVRLADEVRTTFPTDERTFLQTAHQRISERLSPVYTLRERQSASTTLARGRGSCSQRMAVLEAVARNAGIGTRCRALWIDGQFWSPRFQQLRHVLPRRVLLTWPEFFLDGHWVDFAELYGSLAELADHNHKGFTNTTGETLFEAVSRTAVDWYGQTNSSSPEASCDLSSFVIADNGIFPSRDAVFEAHGLLMQQPGGCLFELIFGGHKAA